MAEKTKKIVIAEDDEFFAKVFKDKLMQCGYEVELAMDGEEAIEIINSDPPTLIILDIMMPKKNGYEVLQEIKAAQETKDIPVVILSNLAHEEDVKKGMDLGAIEYIIKGDYSLNKVLEMIKKHLE